MRNVAEKIRHYGIVGSVRRAVLLAEQKSGFLDWKFRNAPIYRDPTPRELAQIEVGLREQGVAIEDFIAPEDEFSSFKSSGWFPDDYHGGRSNAIWDEKVLEHWIAAKLLGLFDAGADNVYVDVGAGGSPWAEILRDRVNLSAYAVDLWIGDAFKHLPYYRVEDATHTDFNESSVSAASLHCSYEMFGRDDDMHLIDELARVLKPGGRAVILPLYMHTHYCAYSTPDYFGKGYSDPNAKEYIRFGCRGIPSSRKYDPATLLHRVLGRISGAGMRYRLLALRNKQELGRNIYCHFILVIDK